MINRRELALAAVPMAWPALGQAKPASLLHPPDLSFLREGPLVNLPRARELMAVAGLDALVVTQAPNVFYLSGHWPQLDRMGLNQTAIAILPRDPARPPALVMHAFLHYYTHSDESPAGERSVYTYNQPADRSPLYPARDESLVTPREQRRRAAVAAVRANVGSEAEALGRALRDLKLDAAKLGVDAASLPIMLGGQGIDASSVFAENTLRRIRLVKSPREIALMRLAAQSNVDAALAAVAQARAAGDTRTLRAAFCAEAARRGNAPVFMVIDGSSSEVMNAPLTDGQAFSIDCVSSLRFYHGDFARSVFVGEPRASMKQITAWTLRAWQDIQRSLRPGLRFADIVRIGRESLQRQGADIRISFTPHSVGLFHTDHPFPTPEDPTPVAGLVLEENMIISVDCPLGNAGAGGSSHLEDLLLIGAEGAQPIHRVPQNVLVV